ncbi:hypothetical protein ZWY2020_027941 [Hordeum vulgare]|nr:hypothetical protein ZWY2020_027941 [Hordeum vulgare]
MEVGGEDFAVGVVISAKTTLGEEEDVGRAERGKRRNVRVLKANYIQEFSVVGKYDDPLDPAGCVLDLAAIHAREEAALRVWWGCTENEEERQIIRCILVELFYCLLMKQIRVNEPKVPDSCQPAFTNLHSAYIPIGFWKRSHIIKAPNIKRFNDK